MVTKLIQLILISQFKSYNLDVIYQISSDVVVQFAVEVVGEFLNESLRY